MSGMMSDRAGGVVINTYRLCMAQADATANCAIAPQARHWTNAPASVLLCVSFNLAASLGKSEAKGDIGVIAEVTKILEIDGR